MKNKNKTTEMFQKIKKIKKWILKRKWIIINSFIIIMVIPYHYIYSLIVVLQLYILHILRKNKEINKND